MGKEGVRVNAVAAGPLATTAAKNIPGFGDMDDEWDQRAPLGWDSKDAVPVAKVVNFLFSEFQNCDIFFPKIRFRRAKFRSSSAGAHPRQRSPSPGQSAVSKLTNPETPRLLTRGRVRPTNNEDEKPK